jgi:hypothetical protein
MTKFSVVSSWLASIACGVCLVLAVLATPGIVHADTFCSCCGTDPGSGDPIAQQVWRDCLNDCMQHNGECDSPVPPRMQSCTSCTGQCPSFTAPTQTCGSNNCDTSSPQCLTNHCTCDFVYEDPVNIKYYCRCLSNP